MIEAHFNFLNHKLDTLLEFIGLSKNKFTWVQVSFDNENKVYDCKIRYGGVLLLDFIFSESHLDVMLAMENLSKHSDMAVRSNLLGALFASLFRK